MSRTLVGDCETNGFLEDLTTIHSLCLKDVETNETWSCHNQEGSQHTIEDGLELISNAGRIIGHNFIKFDLPALQKVYPNFTYNEDAVFDTLVASRLIWTNLFDKDEVQTRKNKNNKLTPKLKGSHGLEAWGMRLGNWKGDYAKIMAAEGLDPWSCWTPQMQEYCDQDVEVNTDLYRLILSKNYSEQALELEHKVAFIMAQQERNGFAFDVKAAEKLLGELMIDREKLGDELTSLFPPWVKPDGPVKYPKRSNRRLGYSGSKDANGNFTGHPYQPIKIMLFNPNSRDHIADRLINKYGWKPKVLTEGGKPKIDEKVLGGLKYPEAKNLAHYMTIQKRIGQLAEGKNAWLKHVKPTGKIHGSINTNGAVTGRATHSHPNIAQVPSVTAYRGRECRSLFKASRGYHLLGCDVSGLELRMLGHFMARYDDGAYAREVVEGDIHTVNQLAAGLPSRDNAKTFIYGFLYGAGAEKIGSIIGRGKTEGNRLKTKFLEATPALKHLITNVKKSAKRNKKLIGLDGRYLHIRSDHAALNTLLQSAGALVCKQWIVEFNALLKEHGLSNMVRFVAWVHDELQLEVRDDLISFSVDENGKDHLTSVVGDLCIQAIEAAGAHFSIKVPLTGEYNIGSNWAETH